MIFTSFRILVSFLFVCSSALFVQASERLTGQDIADAIQQEAENNGVDVRPIVAPQKIFYPCNSALLVAPKTNSWQTVMVSCDAPYAWRLNFRTELAVTKAASSPVEPLKSRKAQARSKDYRYVVLKEPLSKGAILSTETEYGFKDYHYEVRGAYTNIEQLLGRKLKTSVPMDMPVLSRYLTADYVVEKNNVIDIVLTRGGIRISGKAVALSNGQLGEIILVSNLESGVKLKARIKNEREAEIITKQLN